MKRKSVEPVVKEFIGRIRDVLGERVKEVVLFGSRARGDARKDSDYDILLVLENPNRELRKKVYKIVAEFNLEKDVLFSILIRDAKIREYERALPIGAQIAEHGIPL